MNSEETQVLELMEYLLTKPRRDDRTGVGTHSSFGHRLEFDLSDGKVPLLTTKEMYHKSVIEELVFFIQGKTDTSKLKTKIWRGNTSKANLEKLGLDYDEGEMGPLYGFQWRMYGCDYETIVQLRKQIDELGEGDMSDVARIQLEYLLDKEMKKGKDQLAQVIDTLKSDPSSRRMVVSAWNAQDIGKMVLPPCHVLFQFYVVDGKLDLQMYQRSADVFLGLPFNIASYAILLHMVAKEVNLKPGRLIICLGDTHIYSNHVDAVKAQLSREPLAFPTIKLADKKFFDMTKDDVEIVDYQHYEAIKADMAI